MANLNIAAPKTTEIVNRHHQLFELKRQQLNFSILNYGELGQIQIDQMTELVQAGLTIYKKDKNAAKNDLCRHLELGKIELIIKDRDIVGFGIYFTLSENSFEISRVLSLEFQGRGLGKYLTLSGCNQKNKCCF